MKTSSRVKIDRGENLCEQLPRRADERPPGFVFGRARRFADAHQVRVRIALARHGIRRRRVERTPRARRDVLPRASSSESSAAIGPPNSSRRRRADRNPGSDRHDRRRRRLRAPASPVRRTKCRSALGAPAAVTGRTGRRGPPVHRSPASRSAQRRRLAESARQSLGSRGARASAPLFDVARDRRCRLPASRRRQAAASPRRPSCGRARAPSRPSRAAARGSGGAVL